MPCAVCPSFGRRIPRVTPGAHTHSRLTPRRCKALYYRSLYTCLYNATWRRTARSNDLTEPSVLNGSWQIRFSIKLWLFGCFKIILLPWSDCYKQYCTTSASPIIMTLAIRRTANKQASNLHRVIFSKEQAWQSDLRKQKEKRHAHLTFFYLTSEAHPTPFCHLIQASPNL